MTTFVGRGFSRANLAPLKGRPTFAVLGAGCWVLGALLAPLGAQQAQPPREQPVFRTGATGIEVDARVFDREGRFIDDLRIEDIEVLEDGVPQAVRALVLVRGPASAATAGLPTPPADTASAPSGAPAPRPAPQTWVFVFDLNHLTPGGGFDRAKSAVETFLRDRFKDGDLGGVVAGGRMVNNRLTSVRSELVAAAATVKPLSDQRSRVIELTREWPRLNDIGEAILIADGSKDALQRAVLRACSDDPSACAMTPPDLRILDKARRAQQEAARASLDTLNSVNALASGLARIPGPKTIVFLSDGFVTSQAETTLRSVVGQTTRAGGRVYAIDVRGLNRGAAARITDQPAAGDSAGGPPAFDMGEDGPNSLAVDTGGFVIRNENNIGRALGEIAADANLYYVISYQPENANFDGKYRKIEVRVKRQGAKVRARRGYLALQPSQMLIPQPIGRGSGPDPGAPTPEPPPAMRVRPDGAAAAMTLAGEDLARTDALSAEGWSAFQRGDVESAIGPLTRAAAQPNVRPWVLYVLGLSHAALNQPRDAIAAWERVRAAAPEFPPIYMDLAATYGHIGELTSALAVLRDAESRWPDDADVLNAVGVILVRRGVLDDAITAFVKAAASAPEDPVAYLNLGRAYEMRYVRGRRYIESQQRWVAPEGDRQKAIQHFERYIALKGPYADQATEAITRLKWGGG